MLDFIRGRFSHQFNSLRRDWCESQGLPLTEVLSAERLQQALDEEGVCFRDSTFTPLVTLWTFLAQVFSPDHSCREAVSRLVAFFVGQGRRPCAAGTATYCKARKRLPEKLLARLVHDSGQQLHERVSAQSLAGAGAILNLCELTSTGSAGRLLELMRIAIEQWLNARPIADGA